MEESNLNAEMTWEHNEDSDHNDSFSNLRSKSLG